MASKMFAGVTEPAADSSPSAQRVAENQARFREANERISTIAERADVERIPFVCECADAGCREILRLVREEYEAIRADGRRFLNAPGHEDASSAWGVVVDRRDRYVIVEKIGEAGDRVEASDPRAEGDDDDG